jgi:hypothetical protein
VLLRLAADVNTGTHSSAKAQCSGTGKKENAAREGTMHKRKAAAREMQQHKQESGSDHSRQTRSTTAQYVANKDMYDPNGTAAFATTPEFSAYSGSNLIHAAHL